MTRDDDLVQDKGARAARGAAQLVCSPPAGGQPEWGVRAGQAAGEGPGGPAEGPALPPHPPASRHQVCCCMLLPVCVRINASGDQQCALSSPVCYQSSRKTKCTLSVPFSACCCLFVFYVKTCGDQQCVSSTHEGAYVWIILCPACLLHLLLVCTAGTLTL